MAYRGAILNRIKLTPVCDRVLAYYSLLLSLHSECKAARTGRESTELAMAKCLCMQQADCRSMLHEPSTKGSAPTTQP